MSVLKNPSRFCLFCYKSTESSVETNESSDKIKIFTKVLNRLQNADFRLIDNLPDKQLDINELLVSCSKCQRTIIEICETFHKIKTLELQLDWKFDKLKEKISYANKVPSRWVNVNKDLDELYQNDPSKKSATQSKIRELRRNVINAGNRK